MAVTELNHYFVRANDLEKTKDFYCDVLGFEVMPRPTFPFPGYWLGVNGKIQVHMGPDGIEHADLYYLGTPKGAATDHAGVVDHIAFLATDPAGFSRAPEGEGGRVPAAIAPRVRSLPDLSQGPERPHHRAQLLRAQGRQGLGRGGLLGDAQGRRNAGVTRPGGRGARLRGGELRRGDAPRARPRARRCASGPTAPKPGGRWRRRRSTICIARACSDFISPGAGAAWSFPSCRCSTSRPRSPAAAPRRAGTSPTWASTTGCSPSTTSGPRTRCGARTPTR